MKLMRLRAAGFILQSKGTMAFDPYLFKGDLTQRDIQKYWPSVSDAFVGHGHFDHVASLPMLSELSDYNVHAAGLTRQLLKWRGISSSRLETKTQSKISDLNISAVPSRHARFDRALVVQTLKRLQWSNSCELCKKILLYPKGVMRSYIVEFNGRKLLFVSSAGCTPEELKYYRELGIYYFLVPLQGHSEIEKIVAQMINVVNPKIVIPHHYDDFSPPLSEERSVGLLKFYLHKLNYRGNVIELPQFEMNEI